MSVNNTAVAKKENVAVTVAQFLNADTTKKYLDGILKQRAGQFVTSLVSLSNLTPGLTGADPRTLMYCGLKAASLNLPLDNNLGFAYAIPYNNKKDDGKGGEIKVLEAQFQLGYRGYVQLAQRTGQYKNINVIDVRVGELEKWDQFTEELTLCLIDDLEKRIKQPVIGYAGYFELLNGYRKTTYWTKDRVMQHAKRFSKAFKFGPWQTDFDQMAKKTVIKELLSKWGPLSTEIIDAVKFDQAVIREKEGAETPDYIDVPGDFVVDATNESSGDLEAEFQRHLVEEAAKEGA